MDGILLIDKDAGMTSHDVVDAVRRRVGQRDVGHAGTLDPAATGLLVLCLGRALRIVEFLEAHDKEYEVAIRLGRRTDTDDAEGKILEDREVRISKQEVEASLVRFVGAIVQKPPRYSAIKRQGKKLYEYAREGKEVDLPERTVRVDEFALLAWTPPILTARVRCSKGTYIRSLARDLGGSVLRLRRTESGPFRIADAVKLDGPLDPLPVDAGLAHLPEIRLSEEDAAMFAHGRTLPASLSGDLARVYVGGTFLGIGERVAGGMHPRKVLAGIAEERI